MIDPAVQTVDAFAKRSNQTVVWLALAFGLGGALMDIVAETISAIFMKGSGLSMFWGIWIPFCFLTIPPIHYLCRRIQELERRIDSLNQRDSAHNTQ